MFFQYRYLLQLIRQHVDKSMMVFCNTTRKAIKTTFLLRECGLKAIPIHGQLSQLKRMQALEKFKTQERSVLVCTDVASRYYQYNNIIFVNLLL